MNVPSPSTSDTETSQDGVDWGVAMRLYELARAQGELRLPCVPAMLEIYMARLQTLFAGLGIPFTGEELQRLRSILAGQLEAGYAESDQAFLHFRFEPAAEGRGLTYEVFSDGQQLEDRYASWLQRSEVPRFGDHADAMVLEMARGLDPRTSRILDVGAGTGRNAVALAREGFRVDALERMPTFAAAMRAEVEARGVPLRVLEADILGSDLKLESRAYSLVVASELVSHFRGTQDLRCFFTRAAEALHRSGVLVCNLFLANRGYAPSALVRQASPAVWCTVFSEGDLNDALSGLPLRQRRLEPAAPFEKKHLPKGHYPHASWYEAWARGHNLVRPALAQAPMQLFWLCLERTSEA